MDDEEYQIRRKFENRNLMQELEWVSHYPPRGMSNQDMAFIRWLAMTAYDKINELEQTSVPVHDIELILDEVAKPQWIPATERFPKFGVKALCKCRANIYEVLTWTAEGWEHDPQHIYMSGFVTHWMRLPEPPKEGE